MKKPLVIASLIFGLAALGKGVSSVLTGRAPEPVMTYWVDGQPKSSTVYVDGVKSGPFEQWYPNGQKECEGYHRAGLREGTWSFWNEDGSLDVERSGEYRDGRKVVPAGL